MYGTGQLSRQTHKEKERETEREGGMRRERVSERMRAEQRVEREKTSAKTRRTLHRPTSPVLSKKNLMIGMIITFPFCHHTLFSSALLSPSAPLVLCNATQSPHPAHLHTYSYPSFSSSLWSGPFSPCGNHHYPPTPVPFRAPLCCDLCF